MSPVCSSYNVGVNFIDLREGSGLKICWNLLVVESYEGVERVCSRLVCLINVKITCADLAKKVLQASHHKRKQTLRTLSYLFIAYAILVV